MMACPRCMNASGLCPECEEAFYGPQRAHPLDCPQTHWGIADCEECGLTADEQADFPAVVPARYGPPKEEEEG